MFKSRGSGKGRSGIEALYTHVLKLRPSAILSISSSGTAPEIYKSFVRSVKHRLRQFNLQHPHERDEETHNHNGNLFRAHLGF